MVMALWYYYYSIIYIMTGWSRDDEFNNFSHFMAVT